MLTEDAHEVRFDDGPDDRCWGPGLWAFGCDERATTDIGLCFDCHLEITSRTEVSEPVGASRGIHGSVRQAMVGSHPEWMADAHHAATELARAMEQVSALFEQWPPPELSGSEADESPWARDRAARDRGLEALERRTRGRRLRRRKGVIL